MWFIIVNPVAANGEVEKRWPHIERVLQEEKFAYTVHFTQFQGHAIQLVDTAALNGHRQILAIGGDGTNHEVVNGILLQPHCPPEKILYALLPVGTGNDWARQYKITHQVAERIRQLKHPRTCFQDVGKVDYFALSGERASRFFANVAGLAYDAFVVKKLLDNRIPTANKLIYLASIARYLMEYTPQKAEINADGNPFRTSEFYTINIGVCRYSGGGMQFVPHAVPDDGLLALTTADKLPKWKVLALTPKFYNGSLLTHPKVHHTQAKELLIQPLDTDSTLLLEADGEFLGKCPAQFTIFEKKLWLAL